MTWQPISSPCIKVCVIDAETQWCLGCQRSLSEIASWGTRSSAARDEVMADLPRRRGVMGNRARSAPGR